jgi:cysteine desulfurase/selenocysteine lyase
MSLDVEAIRKEFPILESLAHGKPLVYLDSANTSQKPQPVLAAMTEHYAAHNGNVSRSVHTVGTEATQAYEAARGKVAGFVGAYGLGPAQLTSIAESAFAMLPAARVVAGDTRPACAARGRADAAATLSQPQEN